MKLDELQREAERLSPDEQRKLISLLVAMNIRRDEGYHKELSRPVKELKVVEIRYADR
jgi:hypothetical protein